MTPRMVAAADRSTDGGGRRPRTAYLRYRRYRRLGRLSLIVGALCGALVSGYALVPLLLAGERVPRSSFLIAIALIAASALVPFAIVRWRWAVLRRQLEEE